MKRVLENRVENVYEERYKNAIACVIEGVSHFTNEAGLDEDGWHCIIECVFIECCEDKPYEDGQDNLEPSEDELVYVSFISPHGKGDSRTMEQLSVLRNHVDHYMIGEIPEEELTDGEENHDLLGAVAIPYSYISFGSDNVVGEGCGYLRVSFGGATEHTNLLVATYAARLFSMEMARQLRNETNVYNWSVLKKCEAGRVVLALMGIS